MTSLGRMKLCFSVLAAQCAPTYSLMQTESWSHDLTTAESQLVDDAKKEVAAEKKKIADSKHLSTPAKNVVALDIYYEALCPFCEAFFVNALEPLLKDPQLKERVTIGLFPSGNSMAIPVTKISEGFKFFHADKVRRGFEHVFMCQHGERECLGNMIQACAMKLLQKQEKYLPMVLCMAQKSGQRQGVEMAAFNCMKELDIDADKVLACTKEPSSNAMMYQIWQQSKSLSPPRTYVPWITLDEDHVALQGSKEMWFTNLRATVCRKLDEPRPDSCASVQDTGGGNGLLTHLAHPWLMSVKDPVQEDVARELSVSFPDQALAAA